MSRSYPNIETALNYFMSLLQEPKPGCIASIVKYAQVDEERIVLRAIKQKTFSGFTWNLEINIG